MAVLGSTVRVAHPTCPECGCAEWDVAIEATGETLEHDDEVEVLLRATGASCVCCGFAVRLDGDSAQ